MDSTRKSRYHFGFPPSTMGTPGDITRLLDACGNGDPVALGELWRRVQDDLRTMSRRALRRNGHDLTLEPTAAVSELFLRLHGGTSPTVFTDRKHFFGSAAIALERVLADHARAKRAIKREGGRRTLPLAVVEDEACAMTDGEELDRLLAALGRLADAAPRAAEVVRLRYLSGLDMAEIAATLDVSERTVHRDWLYGKAYLREAMEASQGEKAKS
jgi:RNA polymerase sigma factor (TIGR02999 family)